MVDEYERWVTTFEKGSIEIDLERVDLYVIKGVEKYGIDDYIKKLVYEVLEGLK